MEKQYTIDEIKENLQNVTIKVGKKMYVATVRGRKNQFATVSAMDKNNNIICSYEFSWQAIQRATNRRSVLTV